ncbi:uncharacterized protein J3D65DRAFT_604929 [Phyllosticta citribraziliensis]|uniref:Uncharacterized protein n=1 Tax=Phyllosticta citribraziliensis TaxID=989973 RepID=A0ABR1LHB9_9PEZI
MSANNLPPSAFISPFPPRFWICAECLVPRAIQYLSKTSGVCRYCDIGSKDTRIEHKYCIDGGHDAFRVDFFDPIGEEMDTCLTCQRLDLGPAKKRVDTGAGKELPGLHASSSTTESSAPTRRRAKAKMDAKRNSIVPC